MFVQLIIGEDLQRSGRPFLLSSSARTHGSIARTASRYQVSLEDGSTERIDLVRIEIDNNDLVDLLRCVREWSHRPRIPYKPKSTTQFLDYTQASEERGSLQALLEQWGLRYRHVVTTLLELDSFYDSQPNRFGTEQKRTMHIGDIVQRYSGFLLREISQSHSYGSTIDRKYKLSLELAENIEIVLGHIPASKNNAPEVVKLVEKWLDGYSVVIDTLEKRLQHIENAEALAVSTAFLIRHKHTFQFVKSVLDDVIEGE